MSEYLEQTQLLEQIKQIIKSKNWYALTESNRFVWENSVALMAEIIGKEIGQIQPQQLKEIIEDSFDEEALSRAGSEYFIDCLLKIDPKLVLWSEGDPAWQKQKAKKTGLINRPKLRTEFISKDKTVQLKDLIISLVDGEGKRVCALIIDDKIKNLEHATNLQEQVRPYNISVETFQLNLRDIEANPSACLAFIAQIKEKNIRIIVDMDGVIVDTNRVLAETVSQKLAKIFKK